MVRALMGLIHRGCGGMVAPLFDQSIDEAEFRAMVGDNAYCMRCGAPAPGTILDAEYMEVSDDPGPSADGSASHR